MLIYNSAVWFGRSSGPAAQGRGSFVAMLWQSLHNFVYPRPKCISSIPLLHQVVFFMPLGFLQNPKIIPYFGEGLSLDDAFKG
jgi:hypothetical protein